MSMTSPYRPNAKSAQPAVQGLAIKNLDILCNSSAMHHTGGAPLKLKHQFR